MGFALKATQRLPLTINVTDAKGNPAKLETGSISWGVSDDSLLALDVAADGLSATVSPKGPTGSASVTVTGDGDLTSAVKSIVGTLEIDVVAADVVAIIIVAGTPVDAT